MRGRIYALVAVALAALLLSGCGLSTTVSAIQDEPEATSTSPSSTQPAVEGHWCGIELRCKLQDSSELAGFYAKAVAAAEQFRVHTYAHMPEANWYYGERFEGACQPNTEGSGRALYCTRDDTIFVQQDMAWELYQAYPISPLVLVGHELGHHIQWAWMRHYGIRWETRNVLRLEKQADCITGAFLGWLQGVDSQFASANEFDQALAVIAELGSGKSSDDATRTHGVPTERVYDMEIGFSDGLEPGCNQFSPPRVYN